jgi:hypothetical protein
MIFLQIMGPVSAVVLVVMFIVWLFRRRPYRDGYRVRMTPPSQPDEPLPAPRITLQHVTPGAADGVEIIDGKIIR